MTALIFAALPAWAEFTITPYIQNPSPTSMKVMWESDTLAEATVALQPDGGNAVVVAAPKPVGMPDDDPNGDKGMRYVYDVTLTGLEPATKYTYVVKSGNDVSKESFFNTFPEDPDTFTFIAYGDSRSHPDVHRSVVINFARYKPAFILHSGDMVVSGKRHQWRREFFEPLADVIDHIPLFGARGNHEGDGQNMDLYLSPPDDANFNHAFEYGPAYFICLEGRRDAEKIAWIDRSLGSTQAHWRFAFYHYPNFNVGGKSVMWGHEDIVPLFRKHKLDMGIAGDSHHYERFHPLVPLQHPEAHPVTYVVSGGGGAPKYGSREHPCVASTKSISHFLVVKVSPEEVTVQAVENNNQIYDSFTMSKKDGRYDETYLASAMPEEAVVMSNYLRGNRSRLKLQLSGVPSPDAPVEVTSRYTGPELDFPVKGTVTLSEQSRKSYVMEPAEAPLEIISEKGSKINFLLRSKARLTLGKDRALGPPLSFTYRYKIGTVDLESTWEITLEQVMNEDPGWQTLGTGAPDERKWSYLSFTPTHFKPESEKYWSKGLPFPTGSENWFEPAFDTSEWKAGRAPIGVGEWRYRQTTVENASNWGSGDYLLMRTTFELDDTDYDFFRVRVLAKESFKLYLNGKEAPLPFRATKEPTYQSVLLPDADTYLVRGKNVLAALVKAGKAGGKPIGQADFCLEGLNLRGRGAK